ncbi:MAG: hypothetical protein HDR95_06020 [Bacteroides sp.]|nr:hypothetical protein [Bacteroides sp.]
MAITVGLDFGTHQTKICIENSDSPLHKTYEFYEWDKGVYAFPSIIQINNDRTVRYGSIDLDTCLVARKKKVAANPGKLDLPPQPTEPNVPVVEEPKLPAQPVHTFVTDGGLSISVPYKDLYGIGRPLPQKKGKPDSVKVWHKKCQKLKLEYEKRKRKWVHMGGKRLGLPMPVEPVYPPKPTELDSASEVPESINPLMIASVEQKGEYQNWLNQCASIKKQYNRSVERRDWIISQHKKDIQRWENECERITRNHSIQKKLYEESLVEYPLVYRYFKQATFSAYVWDYEIKASDLTVLYLANIIFRLEERFGTDFSIQMGIPASKATFSRLKPFASGYLIQAIRLVEDVFQNNYEKFLVTPFEELLSLIPKYEYSADLKMQYGLIILPEAYAALRSLTANSRIPRGMSIMVDMGGGTTDISFFVIEDNGEPHIYHFESIAKGLNFFLEYEDRHSFRSIDFSRKKELEDLPEDVFNKALSEFKGNVNCVIKRLTDFLHRDTISRGFMKSAFRDAIQNRPTIYTGGGCYDNRMRMPIYDFSDVKYIDKGILGIPNVVDESRVTIPYSLMATAFGLSIQRLDDDIKVSNKEDLFAKYSNVNEQDARWNAYREHGMYED